MNRLVVASVALLAILVASSLVYLSFGAGGQGASEASASGGPSSSFSSVPGQSGGCGSASDWTTYHANNSRAGYASQGASKAETSWRSQELDGEVYAEPVLCGGSLFVATENDTVYSLDATTGTVLWRAHLGTPMRGSALPCGDIGPSGITGTPVIDRSSRTIYVVAFETPGVHQLVALDTGDGRVLFSRQVDPPGADPLVQQERGALSLANGRVYVPFGGLFGDCGDYHGWVVGTDADGKGGLLSYMVQSGREAGIWAPSGAAVDSSGDLFVTTGNGASNSQFDQGNSVIKLSPALVQLGYFAPDDWQQLNQGDTDLGSVGPLLLGNGELFQVGKEGVGYLVNASDLGGIGGQVYAGRVCSSAYGGAASAGSKVFVPCTDGLVALGVTRASFQVVWKSPGFPAGPPIVTGGTVWALDTSSGTLHGYDAATGAETFTFTAGGVTRFTTPSFGDGRVFVAAGTQVVAYQVG